jgi:hypothetical protein
MGCWAPPTRQALQHLKKQQQYPHQYHVTYQQQQQQQRQASLNTLAQGSSLWYNSKVGLSRAKVVRLVAI